MLLYVVFVSNSTACPPYPCELANMVAAAAVPCSGPLSTSDDKHDVKLKAWIKEQERPEDYTIIACDGHLKRFVVRRKNPAWAIWGDKVYKHSGIGAPQNWKCILTPKQKLYEEWTEVVENINVLQKRKQAIKAELQQIEVEEKVEEKLNATIEAHKRALEQDKPKAKPLEEEKPGEQDEDVVAKQKRRQNMSFE